MAKFIVKMPDDLMKQFSDLENNVEEMVGAMTTAGAKVVEKNIRNNIIGSFKNPAPILEHLKITKVYENGKNAIGNKIAFYGYLPFSGKRTKFSRKGGNGSNYISNKGVPVEFIVNVTEYGKSGKRKRPFVRKSFDNVEITKAMLKEQEKYLPKED